ncbi:MAG: hypothetical protein II207_07695 [Clostridia bacterium]|nr:hypothetical protein [Clostridia bacterium]
MEKKSFLIETDKESPLRRVLKRGRFWVFIACSLLVAVCEAIDGNWLCVLWVIIAASYSFFADLFKEFADDYYELNIDLIKEREILLDALKEKDNKITELQTENISLRFGKTTKL